MHASSCPSDIASDMEETVDDTTSAPAEAGNQGWADVMSRLLTAPSPKKKYIILSKAKKTLPRNEVEDESDHDDSEPGFEVDGAEAKPAEKRRRKVIRSRAVKRKEDVEKNKKVSLLLLDIYR